MKDPVKEFEKLENRINLLYEGLGFLNPFNLFKKSPKQTTSASEKHSQGVETGSECKPGFPNRRFSSKVGSNYAEFIGPDGRTVTGKVQNIEPFLSNAGLSKRELRCYNIEKDPLRIAWLFNGTFDADFLDWDKKRRKVILQGDWISGDNSRGIMLQRKGKAAKSPLVANFYILKKGEEKGPFSAKSLISSYLKGKIDDNTIVRQEDLSDYQQITDNKILSYLIKSIAKKPKKSKNKGFNPRPVNP